MTSHPLWAICSKKTLGGSSLVSGSVILRIVSTLQQTQCDANFILDEKKLVVDMFRLVTIAVEIYSSYCHSIAVMASRLNLSSYCNQENIIWSGLPIIDTSRIIWICVSNQLQLIRFHVVLCRYRITFLTVFQWQISRLTKYLLSFSTVYATSGRV